jgi:uncharacterized protein (TIGR03792 family)
MRKSAQTLIYSLCLGGLFCWLIVLPARPLRTQTTDHVVEWLQFQVPTAVQAKFIQSDRAIWTTFLSQQQGFLRKEVLTNFAKPEELTLLIHWQTLADWQQIPQPQLDKVQTQFIKALGADYPVLESRAYQVRDPNHIQP